MTTGLMVVFVFAVVAGCMWCAFRWATRGTS